MYQGMGRTGVYGLLRDMKKAQNTVKQHAAGLAGIYLRVEMPTTGARPVRLTTLACSALAVSKPRIMKDIL